MPAASPTPIAAKRHRLALQAMVPTPDDAGGRTESFVTLATVWAEIRYRGGEERLLAGRPEQAARHLVSFRWRGGVDAGMRLVGGARVFQIISAGDPDGTRRRITCLCEEITP
jgi:SPP1 family predicted phage head-tail adaptor